VSKKAAKRTKAATTLPLVSPHWWPREKTVAYSRAHGGENADVALTAAVNRGELPVKIEWVDQQTNPPSLVWKLLLPQDYEARPGMPWETELWFSSRRLDVSWPEDVVVFFWGPTMKRLWPTEEAEPVTTEQQAANPFAPPRRRPGPPPEKKWKQVVVRELLKRAKVGKPLPSAPEMLKFCGSTLDWESDLKSMQELLRVPVRCGISSGLAN